MQLYTDTCIQNKHIQLYTYANSQVYKCTKLEIQSIQFYTYKKTDSDANISKYTQIRIYNYKTTQMYTNIYNHTHQHKHTHTTTHIDQSTNI